MSDITTTRGACLCGEISLELAGDPQFTFLCHCANCQRSTGTAFTNCSIFTPEQVKVLDPNSKLSKYSDGATTSGNVVLRCFCSVCGSFVFGKHVEDGEPYIIASGIIDGIEDKTGPAWTPSVELYTEPMKRKWLGSFGCVKQSKAKA